MNTNRYALGGRSGMMTGWADERQLQAVLDLCVRKAHGNIKRLADEPKAAPWAVDGDFFVHKEGFYDIGNWTSSFFTGMAFLAWRETEDEYFLNQILRLEPFYRAKVFDRYLDTHHDLGFLYSLYSVALYKLTGDRNHREIGLRAAELLAARFNFKGNFIRAWGRMDEVESPIGNEVIRTDNMAIIDSLMNLPLLFWARRETNDVRFGEIAECHADTCLKCFIRPDDSVNNIYRFNPETGRPLGDPNNTYWARGAAWAIYGFALSFGYTRNERYLEASLRIAKKFIANLDNEIVPWNDFHEASHPGRVRDASAGAIAVCGIQELARHHTADSVMVKTKRDLLGRLCGNDYLNFADNCFGVQRRGQGGENGYTSWGDYYLMEAVCRELKDEDTFW